VPPARILVAAALAALGVACRSGPPPAIDPALSARVPLAATVLAGVNLERVRSSPLHQKLPAAVRTFIDSLGTARSVLLASDGANYLVLSGGDRPPMGSPGWIGDAATPHRGAPNVLLARAEPLAGPSDVWVVAAGSANLPLTGNGENLTRMLHATDYATLSVRLSDRVVLDVVGMCRDAETGRHLEETLRAFLMLGAAGARREPALVGLLRSVQITRDDRAVRLHVAADPEELGVLLRD
jgi:hypothetical protein